MVLSLRSHGVPVGAPDVGGRRYLHGAAGAQEPARHSHRRAGDGTL